MRLLFCASLAIAGAFCVAAMAVAGGMTASCPEVLTEDVLKPGRVVTGWVTMPSQQHLRGAGMLEGPPEAEGYRIPDREAKAAQTFVFAKEDGQRWMWCMYGGMRLAKRLDDRATTGTITTKTKKPEKTFPPWWCVLRWLGSFAEAHRDYFATSHGVEVVGVCLHHHAAFIEEDGSVVGFPVGVARCVG